MRLLDRLLRIERLPDGDGPPMTTGERLIGWGADTAPATAGSSGSNGGQPPTPSSTAVAVATNRALWLRDAGEATGWARLVWADIHKATWTGDLLTITPGVEVEPGVVADGPVRRVRMAEPRDLPKEVRGRVTRSVAYTSHHRLTGTRGGVRIVARRVPGEDGLNWVLRFDDGVDRADPLVRAEAEQLLRAAGGSIDA